MWGTKLENLWIGHSAKVANEYDFTATESEYAIASGKINSVDQATTMGFTARNTDESKEMEQK